MSERRRFPERKWAELERIVVNAGGEVDRLRASRERLQYLLDYHDAIPKALDFVASEDRSRPNLWAGVQSHAEELLASLEKAEAGDHIIDGDKPSWIFEPNVRAQERRVIERLIERAALRGETSTSEGRPTKRAHEMLWYALAYFWENDLGLAVETSEKTDTLRFLEAIGECVEWMDAKSRKRRNIRTALQKAGSPYANREGAKN